MKYITLALIMIAPCLAQASQYVTGILSMDFNGRHFLEEVAANLPNCRTVEDIQKHPSDCLLGRNIEVLVPESGDNDPAGAHDWLEEELQSLPGSLVGLAGDITSFAGGRMAFLRLSLHDPIQVLDEPQEPEPCGNYNGVCHHPKPQPEPCGNYNGVCH